ncbi:hypothetical protein [Bacillus solimangrovi]|uniref:Uncharacterized protein n=1 Tax=Bacillus solimangrovi TaxID=1305675 RepID=A0A1E5LKE1_9BACI|nr:hypothetical protein [Bacillus solimangrovi]OEH94557.1 hypothetical protein BFG57_07775 [Bacillus solimangrovi]
MKRYWKIILFCMITVITIGTFYIQSSLADMDYAKVEFEKVSGNENELDELLLYGGHVAGNMHKYLQISSKDTINLDVKNQSLLLGGTSIEPSYKELIEENRDFMRGKTLYYNLFYKDENLLAYANVKGKDFTQFPVEYLLKIDILNKKSEETTSIQLDVPNDEEYDFLEVIEVQVVDGKLQVFIRGSRFESGDELNVYTFDIDEQKLVNKELILARPTTENYSSEIRLISDSYSIKPEKYLLIRTDIYNEETINTNPNKELVSKEMIVYNLENNQSKKVNISDEKLESIHWATINDSTIFTSPQSESEFEISQYDIEKAQWKNTIPMDLQDGSNGEDTPFMKIMNGKLYLIKSTNNVQSIYIRDLSSGELLYEGKLKVKNSNADQEYGRINIIDIDFVR